MFHYRRQLSLFTFCIVSFFLGLTFQYLKPKHKPESGVTCDFLATKTTVLSDKSKDMYKFSSQEKHSSEEIDKKNKIAAVKTLNDTSNSPNEILTGRAYEEVNHLSIAHYVDKETLAELGYELADIENVYVNSDSEIISNIAHSLFFSDDLIKKEMAFDILITSSIESPNFQKEALFESYASTDSDYQVTIMDYFANIENIDSKIHNEIIAQARALANEEDKNIQERALAVLIKHDESDELINLVSSKLTGGSSVRTKNDVIKLLRHNANLKRNSQITNLLENIANDPSANSDLRISALIQLDNPESRLHIN